jgi:endogenous inhibitor of DNA gyrase (YacG/DUF329 family)
MLTNKMKCPICSKRVFDISKIPKEQIIIELKCPQCGKLVKVPCGMASGQ